MLACTTIELVVYACIVKSEHLVTMAARAPVVGHLNAVAGTEEAVHGTVAHRQHNVGFRGISRGLSLLKFNQQTRILPAHLLASVNSIEPFAC